MLLQNILYYLAIGGVLGILLEELHLRHEGKRFTFYDRFLNLIVWPVVLTLFIYHFLKEYYGPNK